MWGDITIKRLSADDPNVALVADWTFEAWGHLHPGLTQEKAIERLKAECGQGSVPSIFVAMQAETPVGTASLIADDMSIRREFTPWLASVFVVPEWRGQGIASGLVKRVEEEAIESGIRHFYLYTPDQQALYRRLGWQDVESLEYRGETVTVMSRQLGL
ncbi:GNAT family N-acetyltransferase [Halomonas sp. QX-2]|jgi:GNAT superfamily N-acetyltransferase|uniref:GNAT family N-acetyltransferase n=1 Tax=Vreelandella sedimenti TaxID=2729618 RepID=A0A7Z0N5N7_9GAMM|nr:MULTISPECIES: GNAT family N-acetyltransferase [Halomonas]NYT72092.1 GNAT family N-acetyltransferase [Halomonas sedimenti]|tara:strand:- start:113846 stop:114322 length:477 start_codon:yes stop_codon:yes gene_type:complete